MTVITFAFLLSFAFIVLSFVSCSAVRSLPVPIYCSDYCTVLVIFLAKYCTDQICIAIIIVLIPHRVSQVESAVHSFIRREDVLYNVRFISEDHVVTTS